MKKLRKSIEQERLNSLSCGDVETWWAGLLGGLKEFGC
jgi:hypothetical protein